MADQLIHKSTASELTESEYEHVDAHKMEGAAIAGRLVAENSSGHLERVAAGSSGQVLELVGSRRVADG